MAARPGKLLTISDLRIYPIKSCRGISLESNTLTRQGLKNDRKWMFIDSNNKFITIRQNSSMTLIKTHINVETQDLEITFPASSSGLEQNEPTTISVPLEPDSTFLSEQCEKIPVEIWEHQTDAYTYLNPSITTPITHFFQQTLGASTDVKLVMKGPTSRIAKGNGSPDQLGRTETINFPDVLPVLVATEESLQELNTRLSKQDNDDDDDDKQTETQITIENFRPNIVLKSALSSSGENQCIPWEEDEWRTLRINPPPSSSSTITNVLNTITPSVLSSSIDMDVSARCARCQVPNVDPETGTKHPSQPWDTLMSYRRVDDGSKYKPCFGMLCCPRREGEVSVGMDVVVLEVMEAAGGKGRHRYIKGF